MSRIPKPATGFRDSPTVSPQSLRELIQRADEELSLEEERLELEVQLVQSLQTWYGPDSVTAPARTGALAVQKFSDYVKPV